MVVLLVLLAGCRTGDDKEDDPPPEARGVGRLVPALEGAQPVDQDDAQIRDCEVIFLDDMTAAPDGSLWLLLGRFPRDDHFASGENRCFMTIDGDAVDLVAIEEPIDLLSPVAVGGDGGAFLVSETQDLLRYRDGQVAVVATGLKDYAGVAASADGTVNYAIPADTYGDAGQVVASAPDGATRVVATDLVGSEIAVAPDGTLYYATTDLMVKALAPDGSARTIMTSGDARPRDDEPATEVEFGVAEIAATNDGFYYLFRNEVWLVDLDGTMHLLLQRPFDEDANRFESIRYTELAVSGDDVFVWEETEGELYRVEPDDGGA